MSADEVKARMEAEFARRLAAKRARAERGVSVTRRVSQVKQPRGGYVNPRSMDVRVLGEGMEGLEPAENVHPALVGLAVDYLARFMAGTPAEEAFAISLKGAAMRDEAMGRCGVTEAAALELVASIRGLDEASVAAALKLCGCDAGFRSGVEHVTPPPAISPDAATVSNVVTMVKRSLAFFDEYGPVVCDGFTFEGGYTEQVASGDGDFLTKDALWDFKVSKNGPTKEHTLQLLMYWRMGLRSVHPEFKAVRRLGTYNPRRNEVGTIETTSIPDDVIEAVERDVIGYE